MNGAAWGRRGRHGAESLRRNSAGAALAERGVCFFFSPPGENQELPLPDRAAPAQPQQPELRESRNVEEKQPENAESKLEGECLAPGPGTWAVSTGFLCGRDVPALPVLALGST